jgi:type VII secretion integral membrane protein EccD
MTAVVRASAGEVLMAAVSQSGFTKATVATDSARVDLALPQAALVGELLPELLRLTGAAPAAAARGWVLSRFGGAPLDSGSTVAELELNDGELIYLAPRALSARPPVFDDVSDAIGEAAGERSGNWRERYSRTAGLGFGAGLLAVAAVPVALFGGLAPTVCALAGALVLLVLAAALARAYADAGAGATLAVVATAWAAAGGDAALSPHGTVAARLVLAAAAAAAVAAIGLLAVGDYPQVFAGLILAGVAAALAGLSTLAWRAAAPTVAGFTVAVVVLLVPLAPLTSLRLAGVTLPTVPGTAAELRAEGAGAVDRGVLDRTRSANHYLSALVISGASVVTAACVVLAVHRGGYGRALCLAAALAMALRARLHTVLPQRLALLLGGAVAYTALAASAAANAHGPARAVIALGGLSAVGAVAFVSGLVVPGRRSAPAWGRALDWLEIVSLTAVIPLAVAVASWYGYFHGLAG